MHIFVVYSMHLILQDVIKLYDFKDGIFSQNIVPFRLNNDTDWLFDTHGHKMRRFFKVLKTQISLQHKISVSKQR